MAGDLVHHAAVLFSAIVILATEDRIFQGVEVNFGMTPNDGRYFEMKAGDLFYIAPGHDSWVVGNQPYVSLHFLGADHYADVAAS